MSASLARYLKDFSAPAAPIVEPPEVFDLSESDTFPQFIEPEEPPIDLEAERRQAYEKGMAAAVQEMQPGFDEKLAAMEKSHAEELARLKEAHEAELAALTATKIEEMRDNLTATLSANTLNALLPVIDEVIAKKAVDELAREVAAIFEEEGDALTITIHGSQALGELLEEKIKDIGVKIRHRDSDGPDLTLEVGERIIVARLSAWAESLRELLK